MDARGCAGGRQAVPTRTALCYMPVRKRLILIDARSGRIVAIIPNVADGRYLTLDDWRLAGDHADGES
jgi:hypothetical protein